MARVFLRHAYRLPRHCAAGIDRYLARLGVDRATVSGRGAPGVDSTWLRAQGGIIARRLADLAEAEAAEGSTAGPRPAAGADRP